MHRTDSRFACWSERFELVSQPCFSKSDSFKPLQMQGFFFGLICGRWDVKHGRTERAACNQSPDFSDGTSSGCQCGVSTPSYFSMVMKTHLMSHRSPLGQNEFNALAELDSVGISSRVFDSIDKPLISVHGSAQYRRQRAIDLVRHFRSSRLPVYSQWSLAHREMRPMYLP